MSTKNIVPQNSNEGGLGTDAKRWAEGHFQTVLQLGGKNVTVPFAVTIPKTSAYTAAPNDYALVDLSAGNVTITLPAAPQDGTIIGVKIIATASNNICTILAGGLNVFTKIAGATTKILKLLEEAAIVQYRAQSNLWIIVSNDLPLEALDYRYDTVALRNTAITTAVGNEAINRVASAATAAANPPFAVIAFTGSEGFGHGTTLTITQPDNGQGSVGGSMNATFFVDGTYDLLSYVGVTGYYPMPGTASPAQETIMFSGQPSSGDTIFCTTIGYGQTITFVPTGNPGGVASLTCEIGATLNDTLNNYASSIGGGTVSGNTVVKFAPGPTGPGSYQDLFIYTVSGYNQSNTSGCSVASSSYNDGAITSLGGADALAGYIANGLNSANGYGGGYSQTIHDSANISRSTSSNYYFTAASDGKSIAIYTNSEGPAGQLYLTASGGQVAMDGNGPLYSVANLAFSEGLPSGTNTGTSGHADSNGNNSSYSGHADSSGNNSGYSGHADSGGNNTANIGHADSGGKSRLDGSHAHAGSGYPYSSNIMDVTRAVSTTDATAQIINYFSGSLDPYTFPSSDALYQLNIVVMGRRTNGSGVARWHKSVLVQVASSAASILAQNDLETPLNASGWGCVVTVANLILNVTVTGATSSNITWTASFHETLCK